MVAAPVVLGMAGIAVFFSCYQPVHEIRGKFQVNGHPATVFFCELKPDHIELTVRPGPPPNNRLVLDIDSPPASFTARIGSEFSRRQERGSLGSGCGSLVMRGAASGHVEATCSAAGWSLDASFDFDRCGDYAFGPPRLRGLD